MLEKFNLVYGKHIISSPTNDHQILWYQTDEGELFGVDKSELTARDKLLLNTFLPPIYHSHTKQTEDEQKWYIYLFYNKLLTV
ncbi:PucR family transcriptional regulator, partial [Bacillus pumilus]